MKVSVAHLAPGPAGMKANDTLHVPPPAATIVPLQLSVVLMKSPALGPPTETADTVSGPPAGLVRVMDWGLLAVAGWTLLSLLVHIVQLAEALISRSRGRPIVSWLA